jgi:hypothetical protein
LAPPPFRSSSRGCSDAASTPRLLHRRSQHLLPRSCEAEGFASCSDGYFPVSEAGWIVSCRVWIPPISSSIALTRSSTAWVAASALTFLSLRGILPSPRIELSRRPNRARCPSMVPPRLSSVFIVDSFLCWDLLVAPVSVSCDSCAVRRDLRRRPRVLRCQTPPTPSWPNS